MNDVFNTALSGALRELNLDLNTEARAQCARYAALLVKANEHVNLTAITDPVEIALKHFADSLSVLSYVDIPYGASVIDVGSGAGFPGSPLLIARPDLKVTLLDGTEKKLNFIRGACAELGLTPAVVHLRAEDAGRLPAYRDRFDFAVARAVADLRVLIEYCLPLVAAGGAFIALKGGVHEAQAAENACSALNGQREACREFELSGCGKRSIIVVRKISQTPPKYPRPSTQITKKPL